MGHWTMMVVGSDPMGEISCHLGHTFDSYDEHKEQLLVPIDKSKCILDNHHDGVALKAVDCMRKKNVNIDETKKSEFWPPAMVIKDNEIYVYKDYDKKRWAEDFDWLWTRVHPLDKLTIYNVHT